MSPFLTGVILDSLILAPAEKMGILYLQILYNK